MPKVREPLIAYFATRAYQARGLAWSLHYLAVYSQHMFLVRWPTDLCSQPATGLRLQDASWQLLIVFQVQTPLQGQLLSGTPVCIPSLSQDHKTLREAQMRGRARYV